MLPELHFKQIREIAANRDLEIETDRFHSMIHEIQIFMNAGADRAAELQAEAPWRNDPSLCSNSWIGEKYARSVVGDIAGVEQIPSYAVSINVPAADHSSIGQVKSFVGRPGNLAVPIGNQETVSLIDDELSGANGDLKNHDFFSCSLLLALSQRGCRLAAALTISAIHLFRLQFNRHASRIPIRSGLASFARKSQNRGRPPARVRTTIRRHSSQGFRRFGTCGSRSIQHQSRRDSLRTGCAVANSCYRSRVVA